MGYGTYIFFCLGVAVRHGPRVSHFVHLSGLTEMRYRGSTSLLAFRGPVHLGLFSRGRCGSPYWKLKKSIVDIS
jgi:hypothetical protein